MSYVLELTYTFSPTCHPLTTCSYDLDLGIDICNTIHFSVQAFACVQIHPDKGKHIVCFASFLMDQNDIMSEKAEQYREKNLRIA